MDKLNIQIELGENEATVTVGEVGRRIYRECRGVHKGDKLPDGAEETLAGVIHDELFSPVCDMIKAWEYSGCTDPHRHLYEQELEDFDAFF